MQTSRGSLRDDFDMTKLQKSLMQQQKRSKRMRDTVAKLTPAEIRSLNNSIAASRASKNSSSSQSRKVDTTTPPLTPDHGVPAQHSASNRNSMSEPTPPRSPDAAMPKKQNSISGNGIYIHSPIPQSHTKAGFVLASNGSRPASASSHRITPTYRGPEVTRPGSFSKLQSSMLTHQIVDNPLSQFSRPRQSRGSGSPSREDRQESSGGHSDTRSLRSQSLPTVSTSSDRPVTPPTTTDLLEETVQVQAIPLDNMQAVGSPLDKARTVAVDGSFPQESNTKSSWRWRKSLHATRSNSNEDSEAHKIRRRSLSWSKPPHKGLQSVAYDNTKAGMAPEERGSLKGILPSDRTSANDKNQEPPLEDRINFDAHPAVRPLSAQSDGRPESKGKGKEKEQEEGSSHDVLSDDSVPMYSRCSCCGKLRKPVGNRSLSPVFENENLRTNFTLEIERADNLNTVRRRSSSSASRQKHTPIIPMIMAEGQTVQAKIAPKLSELEQQPPNTMPVINGRGDLIAAGSEPIALGPKNLDAIDRRMVRFSSLYFPRQQQQLVGSNTSRARMINGLRHPQIRHSMPASPLTYKLMPETSVIEQQRQFQHRQGLTTGLGSALGKPSNDSPLPNTASEKITGEVTDNMNGIDVSLDENHVKSETQDLQYDQPDRAEGVAVLPASVQTPAIIGPSTALSTDRKTARNEYQPTADKIKTKPAGVSFDTSVLAKENVTSNGVQKLSRTKPSSSQSRNFSYKSASVPVPNESVPRTFQTKPKSTVQYLLRAAADMQKPLPSLPTNMAQNDESRKNGTVTSSVQIVKTDSAFQLSDQSDGAHCNDQEDQDDRDNHNNPQCAHRGLTYAPLPLPEFGNDFGDLSTDLGNYFGVTPRGHSNLIESVLAATHAEYDSNNHIMIVGK